MNETKLNKFEVKFCDLALDEDGERYFLYLKQPPGLNQSADIQRAVDSIHESLEVSIEIMKQDPFNKRDTFTLVKELQEELHLALNLLEETLETLSSKD